MNQVEKFEFTGKRKEYFQRATRLEWITIGYLLTVTVVMYLVMGNSQAMKTAWLEDVLSLAPSIAFLISARFFDREPNKDYPYGYYRMFSISFLAGSLALFSIGAFLVVDSTMTLIKAEHPTIDTYFFFDRPVWQGWLMVAALLYSSLPAIWLGYKKVSLAKNLHIKVLYTDADTQKADYETALAAILGVTLVGLGLWWADAVAALFISVSIVRDGFKNVKTAVHDLMDRRPVHVDSEEEDELIEKVRAEAESWDWVDRAYVRFREHGPIYFGEVIVVPNNDGPTPELVDECTRKLRDMDWKLHDIVINPVRRPTDVVE